MYVKVHFDNVVFSGVGARTGPSTFATRLAEGLHGLGHTIADYHDDYDVMLSFIEQRQDHRIGAKLVQRLDGIWFKPTNFELNNRRIKSCYDRADLVIWQSDFDKQMTKTWWGEPKAGTVIHNGVKSGNVDITLPKVQQLRQAYDTIFVCSSNWHPQKRLRANIELFDHLQKWHPNSCLIILGANPDVVVPNAKNIFYTGSVPFDVYMQLYAISDWMLHLAWLDHCPNVVIEALSQNVSIICSESGGTKEIVKEHGLVLQESTSYAFELADYDDPPKIDVTQVTGPLEQPSGQHLCIDIEHVAKLYENALEGIL